VTFRARLAHWSLWMRVLAVLIACGVSKPAFRLQILIFRDANLRVPETQFCRFSRRYLVFVNEPSEHVAAPKTVEGDDGL
jgi:hypothetical protein